MIQVVVEETQNVEIVVEDTVIQAVLSPPDAVAIEVTNVSGTGPRGAPSIVVWNEVPSGVVDGVNDTFTLDQTPLSDSTIMVFKNGVLMRPGVGYDYVLSGSDITFDASQIPQVGEIVLATYGV